VTSFFYVHVLRAVFDDRQPIAVVFLLNNLKAEGNLIKIKVKCHGISVHKLLLLLLLLLLLNRPLLPCGVEVSAEPSASTSILCHNPRFCPVNSSSCHHYTHLFLPRLSRSSYGSSTLCFCFKNLLCYSFSPPPPSKCPAHLNCDSSISICSGSTLRFLLIFSFLILSRLCA
jgi:hypothetical protein